MGTSESKVIGPYALDPRALPTYPTNNIRFLYLQQNINPESSTITSGDTKTSAPEPGYFNGHHFIVSSDPEYAQKRLPPLFHCDPIDLRRCETFGSNGLQILRVYKDVIQDKVTGIGWKEKPGPVRRGNEGEMFINPREANRATWSLQELKRANSLEPFRDPVQFENLRIVDLDVSNNQRLAVYFWNNRNHFDLADVRLAMPGDALFPEGARWDPAYSDPPHTLQPEKINPFRLNDGLPPKDEWKEWLKNKWESIDWAGLAKYLAAAAAGAGVTLAGVAYTEGEQ